MRIYQKSYIALITILIATGAILLVSLNVGLFAISESNMGLIESQSIGAYYLANACAEYAILRIKNNLNYPGNQTLDINGGSCYIYSPEGTGNQNRVIKVTGILDNLTRKIKINIKRINPQMEISSWQEVSEL